MPRGARGKYSEFYFISPYCENGDLYRILEECQENPDTCSRRLNQTDRMRVALQIALAIQYLHTHVPNVREIIFHQDICSSNVVLDKYKNSRLIDFGLAREKDDLSTTTSGKTYYLHPEIGKSGASASVVWDYYSLGVLYRELLTGLPPSGNGNAFLKHFSCTEVSDNLESIWITDDDDSRLNAVTLNKVAFACLVADRENFCIKNDVIDVIKSVFRISIANSSDSNTCELCMINPNGSEAATQMKHTLNCRDSIRLCIACEKNTYLNPVTCYSCEAKLEPIIGHRWGALLVAGNDTYNYKNATAFKEDVESVGKLLISRAPRVIGISSENVKMVALAKPGCEAKKEKLTPLVRRAIEEINAMDIHTLFVYFSCHGGTCSNKENFFQLASEDDKLTVKCFQEMLSTLTKIEKIILLLDCCFPDQINIQDKTIIQINACGREESAQVQEKESLFTKYVIKGLKARSEGVSCEKNDENCRCCQEYWATRKDYITVGSLLEFVASHMKLKSHPEPRCIFVGKANDIKLAYYTDEKVYLEFTDKDDKTQNPKKIPLSFCHDMDQLKSQLLSTFNKGDRSTFVCIQNDTYRKENRFETCDTIDKVMMAWVLRKRLIVTFLERGSETSS